MPANNVVMLKPVRNLKFLIICGVSGSGKNMLEKNLCEQYPDMFVKCEQVTTRPKRSPDEDTYRFIDLTEYCNIQNLLIGQTNVECNKSNEFYGTLVNWNERNRVQTIILNELGVKNFLQNDIREMVNDGIGVSFILLGLDRTDLEEIMKLEGREDRDPEFLTKERSVLTHCNYVINVSKDNYAVAKDVVDTLFPKQGI